VKRTSFLPLLLVAVGILFNASASAQGVQIEKGPAAEASPSGSPHKPKGPRPPTPAEALYDYLQKNHIEVAKDSTGPHFVWTDRILIEIADGPPPEPLATLLSAAPANNGQFAAWVHDTFETQTKAWHPGKKNPHPSKAGTEEIVADAGGEHCYVNPVYLSYVLARYPKSSILIKGPKDPALFTVNGQVRAIVSPWTQLPDGTPLL
jgi:hypothetical protein